MYVTLRRYGGAAGKVGEIAPRIERELVPMLKGQPGFKGYLALASEQGDAVSVTIFEDRDRAARANEQARGWVQANLRDALPDPPEVFAGECGLAEVSGEHRQGAGSGQPLYVLVRKSDLAAGWEEALASARRHSVPVVTGSPGFRGIYIVPDDGDRGRVATVTLFDGREEAQRSHERVVAAMQEKMRDAVPNPPRVAASGLTAILATAG